MVRFLSGLVISIASGLRMVGGPRIRMSCGLSMIRSGIFGWVGHWIRSGVLGWVGRWIFRLPRVRLGRWGRFLIVKVRVVVFTGVSNLVTSGVPTVKRCSLFFQVSIILQQSSSFVSYVSTKKRGRLHPIRRRHRVIGIRLGIHSGEAGKSRSWRKP